VPDEHYTDPHFSREQSAALGSLAEKIEDLYLKASFYGALMSTIAWRRKPKRDCAFRGDNNAPRMPDRHLSARCRGGEVNDGDNQHTKIRSRRSAYAESVEYAREVPSLTGVRLPRGPTENYGPDFLPHRCDTKR
jgi:hypothetical protein